MGRLGKPGAGMRGGDGMNSSTADWSGRAEDGSSTSSLIEEYTQILLLGERDEPLHIRRRRSAISESLDAVYQLRRLLLDLINKARCGWIEFHSNAIFTN